MLCNALLAHLFSSNCTALHTLSYSGHSGIHLQSYCSYRLRHAFLCVCACTKQVGRPSIQCRPTPRSWGSGRTMAQLFSFFFRTSTEAFHNHRARRSSPAVCNRSTVGKVLYCVGWVLWYYRYSTCVCIFNHQGEPLSMESPMLYVLALVTYLLHT